jgi:hypothetical protein
VQLAPADRLAEIRKNLPSPESARTTLTSSIKAERDRLEQRSKVLWAGEDGVALSRVRDQVLFDASKAAEKLGRYEKSNSSEVHRFLNLFYSKRKEDRNRAERRAATSERRHTFRKKLANEVIALLKERRSRRQNGTQGATNRLAKVLSNGNGNPAGSAAEPFVMPKALSERMADSVVSHGADLALITAQQSPPAPENEARPTVSDVLTSERSSTSGETPGGPAASAGESPIAT